MREILFRGKRTDNGEWVYGSLDNASADNCRILQHNREHGQLWNVRVLTETVGQYTGLTDSNGKKIFEGDILQNWQHKAVVTANVFNCGCCHSVYGFSLCDPDGEPTDDITLEHSVVIGNIHDNPELLKREGGR